VLNARAGLDITATMSPHANLGQTNLGQTNPRESPSERQADPRSRATQTFGANLRHGQSDNRPQLSETQPQHGSRASAISGSALSKRESRADANFELGVALGRKRISGARESRANESRAPPDLGSSSGITTGLNHTSRRSILLAHAMSYWDFQLPGHTWDEAQDTHFSPEMLDRMRGGRMMTTTL
jgi:hypothetical protein